MWNSRTDTWCGDQSVTKQQKIRRPPVHKHSSLARRVVASSIAVHNIRMQVRSWLNPVPFLDARKMLFQLPLLHRNSASTGSSTCGELQKIRDLRVHQWVPCQTGFGNIQKPLVPSRPDICIQIMKGSTRAEALHTPNRTPIIWEAKCLCIFI